MISSELLLEAYCRGIFPMGLENGEIGWFSPDPRGILPLEGFHIPHGLRRTLAKNRFEIRIDEQFEKVMRACGGREETWISDEILASYIRLHKMGYAHSVEAWSENGLAGGLYGVSIGGAFFGESMFHYETDASKVALASLVTRLKARGFTLLDIQWVTPHLQTFGAINISKKEYLRLLRPAVSKSCRFV
ncbi:MAG TPA: leucyl/phenylalanyl-tRNA--protein transferase [Chthoniobacterales bacterium]